jgi:hypothetical protein
MTAPRTKQNIFYAVSILISLLLGASTYYLFRKQAVGAFPSDLEMHISIINSYMFHNYTIPHPGFHILTYILSKLTTISYTYVAPMMLSLVLIITVIMIYRILAESLEWQKGNIFLFGIAVALNLAIAIYVPFFNYFAYVGQSSPNTWHNPQSILLKPFAVIAFYYYSLLLKKNSIGMKQYVLLSGALLLSVIMKPSFAFVFMPAAYVYLVLFNTKKLELYWKSLVVFLPSVAMLGYQYFITYQSNSDNSHYHDEIIFTNFGVMKIYSPNVPISILLVLAFPLAVIILRNRETRSNLSLRLAWCVTVVSLLQYAFLAEKQKFEQGAFGFGYIIALFLLFIVSMGEYLSWYKSGESKIHLVRKVVPALVFIAHLGSGVWYLNKLLKGGSYF